MRALLPKAHGRRRRAFWLSWNLEEQRFARSSEYGAMLEREPEALEVVRQRIINRDFDLGTGR